MREIPCRVWLSLVGPVIRLKWEVFQLSDDYHCFNCVVINYIQTVTSFGCPCIGIMTYARRFSKGCCVEYLSFHFLFTDIIFYAGKIILEVILPVKLILVVKYRHDI